MTLLLSGLLRLALVGEPLASDSRKDCPPASDPPIDCSACELDVCEGVKLGMSLPKKIGRGRESTAVAAADADLGVAWSSLLSY